MEKMEYLMESDEEVFRLELKTDSKVVKKQALWAGIKSGMCAADICCGSGKTTAVLHKLVRPNGLVIGVDGSQERMKYAEKHYGIDGVKFICRDIRLPLGDVEMFDFVFARFVLEFYRSSSFEIVKNISSILKPGGILCLIDLDHNCLNHYGLSQKLEKTFFSLMKFLVEKADFDPYAGRKLYSHLFRLGYQELKVDVKAHHLIYGELKDSDDFNWMKKVEIISKKNIDFAFEEFEGGYGEFLQEFKRFFSDPGRFTYTPVISCCGRKPFQ
jgi:ubiquinone/menaquinone biosynthesis C-methylase UbiE